jgi:hypothetical protein
MNNSIAVFAAFSDPVEMDGKIREAEKLCNG